MRSATLPKNNRLARPCPTAPRTTSPALNFVAAVTNSSNAEPERNFSSTLVPSSRKPLRFIIQIAASLQDRSFKYDWIRGESAEQFVHMDENEACLEPSRHRRCNVNRFCRGGGKIRAANNRRLVVLFHRLPFFFHSRILNRQQNIVRFIHGRITCGLSTKQIVAISGNLKAPRH